MCMWVYNSVNNSMGLLSETHKAICRKTNSKSTKMKQNLADACFTNIQAPFMYAKNSSPSPPPFFCIHKMVENSRGLKYWPLKIE